MDGVLQLWWRKSAPNWSLGVALMGAEMMRRKKGSRVRGERECCEGGVVGRQRRNKGSAQNYQFAPPYSLSLIWSKLFRNRCR